MSDYVFTAPEEYAHYDAAKGQVLVIDQMITSYLHVRAGLLDDLVRESCIAELRRQGYTVTAP